MLGVSTRPFMITKSANPDDILLSEDCRNFDSSPALFFSVAFRLVMKSENVRGIGVASWRRHRRV